MDALRNDSIVKFNLISTQLIDSKRPAKDDMDAAIANGDDILKRPIMAARGRGIRNLEEEEKDGAKIPKADD